jgi:hypothetical protein
MLTTGFKLYFGWAFAWLAAAAVYGYTTGGRHIGPITAGYKGPVGEHVGYTALLVCGVVAGAVGLMLVAFRDAGARAAAELLGTDSLPVQTPVGTSYWPLIGAFGAGTLVLGLVLNAAVFVVGLVIIVIAGAEWTMQAWADRATGDPEVNSRLRDRIMSPIELPVGAVLAIVAVPLAASRVFLAVSKFGAVWVATGIAAVIFLVAILIATRPKMSKNIVAGAVLVGGIGLLSAGIVSAAVGQRDFEHHGTEHSGAEGEEHSTEGGTADEEVGDTEYKGESDQPAGEGE